MTTTLEKYKQKAVWLMKREIVDFAISPFQAAAPCGNAYQESMLRPVLENDGIVTDALRGIGWFQWTGPRHRAFIAWCDGAKLSWQSDTAEYGFFKHELLTDYGHALRALKASVNLYDAVVSFEKYYEAAGVVAMGHRILGAQIALDAYNANITAR